MLTIENNQLKVGIDEEGAQLSHLIDKNNNFDYIWNGVEWKNHSPILFPAVGKSLSDEYILNDKTYSMPKDGFANSYEWTVVDKGDDRVSLTLTENEQTLEQYPFEFSLMVTYSLEGNNLHVKFIVRNSSQEKAMPFALGIQPTFNVPLTGDELNFEDYELTFVPEVPELKQYELNSEGLRTGEQEVIASGVKSVLPLRKEEFAKGAIYLTNPGLTRVTLQSPKSDHKISLETDAFDHVALWSLPETQDSFLSIAPINGLPDQAETPLTNWDEKLGNQMVDPDQSLEFTTTISID